MSGPFVHSFTHLKDRPHADRAALMLQKIASLVKPIMRKYAWNLPVLAEFFPDSDNLLGLNVNMGQKICLRLRPARAPDTFHDEEDVVQTMLHELTHNVHSPHDEKFYKFLSGLQDEYDALQRSGYAGEGFFSKGHRVGTNVSHDLPPHLARAKALEAAEKRRQTSRVLGSGGRLGGRINTKGLSPRELAARAAERRARDEKACGSGAEAAREAAKAAKESVEDKIIDLTMDSDSDSDAKRPAAGPSKSTTTQSKRTSTSASTKPNGVPSKQAASKALNRATTSSLHKAPAQGSSGQWSCPTCTLINEPLSLLCDACFSERPPDRAAGWVCLTCGEAGIPHEFWTCSFCGTVKKSS